MTAELLGVAWLLATGGDGQTQGSLRRAISTAYYALFHALAQSNADVLIGTSARDPRWVRAYRALEHATAKRVLLDLSKAKPHPILTFANAFVELQEKRHIADYDPTGAFDAQATGPAVLQATQAVHSLTLSSRDMRLDLATRLLLKNRT